MTVQELLENAQLDALGLLDEREREDFERAFWAAPPGLQTQIRREQARLCRVETLLPDATPREELRQLVLSSIRSAQLTGAPDAAPSHEDQTVAAHDASPRYARTLPMARARGVSRLWRAGAIGFATAAVVLGAAFLRVKSEFDKQQASLGSEADWISLLQQSGRGQFLSDMMVGKNIVRMVMTAQHDAAGDVSVFTDPGWPSVRLYCKNIIPARNCSLHVVALDASGKIARRIAPLPGGAGLAPLDILKSDLGNAEPRQLAIVSTRPGQDVTEGEILFKVA